MPTPAFLQDIIKTSRDMWTKGWAEANGGNITLRLKPEKLGQDTALLLPKGDWADLPVAVPSLGGEKFLVSGTGRYLRNIELFPEKNVGVIELNAAGSAYRPLWAGPVHLRRNPRRNYIKLRQRIRKVRLPGTFARSRSK